MKAKTRFFQWRGTRLITGALAALILIPVPAFALSYLNNWTFSRSRTGGAPLPAPTQTTIGDETFLSINLGTNTRSGNNSSRIIARRDFQITARSEVVNFVNDFAAQLRRATLAYTIQIEGLSPRRAIQTVEAFSRGATTSSTQNVGASSRFSQTLTTGRYRLILTVNTTKSGSGSMWNFATSAGGSPLRLTFGGA